MKKSVLSASLFLIFVLFFQVQHVLATHIQVNNINIVERNDAEKYIIVQFDLSWDYSFRVDDGSNSNWDAAWVFMKYKKTTETNVQWGHATLHGSGHTITGNFTGDTASTQGVVKGIFIYPSVIFNGTASVDNMRLRWDYGDDGLQPEDEVDVRVFGIEMVYVPQGDFYVGSGGSDSAHFYAGGGATDQTFQVSSGSFQIENTGSHLYATGNIDSDGPLATNFPTGYNDFYVMKHNITQQAYVDFLNTLTYAQQDARTPTTPNSTGYLYDSLRHKIKITTAGASGSAPAVYATDHRWVACNFLSKEDVLSYLDWAGLRPLTELEYEKAARGPSNPVENEYAWGNTRIGKVNDISNAGDSNEVAVVSGYQRDITIDHTKVDQDLTNFPVLVKLDSNNFDFTKSRPDGYDIRFYDVSGNSLKYQRIRHDEVNEKAEYWVKVPQVSSSENTVITMEYGDPGASDGADAVNVWNNDMFTSVWHLNEESDGTAGEFKDIIGSNDGQGMGTLPARIESQIDSAQQFKGLNDSISVPDASALDIENALTLSGWIKPGSLTDIVVSDSTNADWNDNQSMSNLTAQDDSLVITSLDSSGVTGSRIANPVSLDSVKRVGSSTISWTDNDAYKVKAFTDTGKHQFKVPEGVEEVEVLVIAGGGGGGGVIGGGGGAGGLVYESNYAVTPASTIDVTVGSGGKGGKGWNTPEQDGEPGENSSFDTIIAQGGGGGSHYDNGGSSNTNNTDIDGGSGGGGASGIPSGGSGISGQGNDGGGNGTTDVGAGGGGSGSAGNDAQSSSGGDGGAGTDYSAVFGTEYGDSGWFCSGGAGAVRAGDGRTPGDASIGGGGNATASTNKAEDGMANTGGGGGGGGYDNTSNNQIGGSGGSGIVLVRYKDPTSVKVYASVSESNTSGYPGVQKYTSAGSHTFTVPQNVDEVEVLVVGGGGAGGDHAGFSTATGAGGGAGGGVVYESAYSVTPGDNISVTVGDGGNVITDDRGESGENSVFGSLTAQGGGGGGNRSTGDGKDGGSGGGAGYNGAVGSGVSGQGYDGGDDYDGDPYNGGGGGGASATGSDANVNSAGNGGNGFATDISGTLRYYGGGGGGGAGENMPEGTYGIGGIGGGGNGGYDNLINGSDGVPNTGGGGGGSGRQGSSAGKGGSGIVIVRWGNEATNGDTIPGIHKNQNLSGKYLWIRQELYSNNSVSTPSVNNHNIAIEGEAVIAGKGENAYQMNYFDNKLRGFINNEEVLSSTLSTTEYQHVALTFDGSNQRVYVNGLLAGTKSLSDTIDVNTTDLSFGTNYEGILDEVRLSDTIRSQAWIKAEYYSGSMGLVNVGGEGALNNAVVDSVSYPAISTAGPLRVGICATTTSSRTAAGSSYWGIPGLSGNVWEAAVTVGNATGRAFTGLPGNGLLNASGAFDVANWDIGGIGYRGGAFITPLGSGFLQISNRANAIYSGDERNPGWGGRGARTAD